MITLTYILVCLLLAWDNAKRIGKDKVINHWVNGSIHVSAALGFALYFGWWIFINHIFNGGVLIKPFLIGLKYFTLILLIARTVFDSALSWIRFHTLGYVSKDPESWADKVEYKLFKGNVILARIVYTAIIIILIII